MSPDAERRLKVYQEGQRAFNAETPCPYTDWRVGTWTKGWKAAEAHAKASAYDPTATVPCALCGTQTFMTGTRRCDRCYELESRIKRDPDLARQILGAL